MPANRARPADLIAQVAAGDRQALARAITLAESTLPEDRADAALVLDALQARTGQAVRVGLTGAPGVGKSTFADALGVHLTSQGHKVAVLAIDPSSEVTSGSILGDKTRMHRLALDPQAFIRPSPGGGGRGGVARRTREAGLLCEAAGFDVILVETIGVGQSELEVAHLVDTVVLLVQAHAGDELQGIKRGVMELADVVVMHKADGALAEAAALGRAELQGALHLLRGSQAPAVVACSSLTGVGIDEVWAKVQQHRADLTPLGLDTKRRAQATHWFDGLLAELLLERALAEPSLAAALPDLRFQVQHGKITPLAAVLRLLARLPRS